MNSRWLLLDIVITLSLIFFVIIGIVYIPNTLLDSTFAIFIGMLFLTSNRLRQKLYFSKLIYWVSQNILKPKTKINHIIGGSLLIILGLLPVTKPLDETEKQFFQDLAESCEFWIAIALALLFNIFVGLYTARRNKKKKQ